jgi:hypothetical protein
MAIIEPCSSGAAERTPQERDAFAASVTMRWLYFGVLIPEKIQASGRQPFGKIARAGQSNSPQPLP